MKMLKTNVEASKDEVSRVLRGLRLSDRPGGMLSRNAPLRVVYRPGARIGIRE
jgi:hypothetical protein